MMKAPLAQWTQHRQAANDTDVAIVGHGGSMEIMDIVANPDSPCIGTVFFHAERYGADLLSFALPIVRGRSAPVVHYVPHEFMGKRCFAARSARSGADALSLRGPTWEIDGLEKTKVAIFGIGFMGRVHTEALRRLGNIEVDRCGRTHRRSGADVCRHAWALRAPPGITTICWPMRT